MSFIGDRRMNGWRLAEVKSKAKRTKGKAWGGGVLFRTTVYE